MDVDGLCLSSILSRFVDERGWTTPVCTPEECKGLYIAQQELIRPKMHIFAATVAAERERANAEVGQLAEAAAAAERASNWKTLGHTEAKKAKAFNLAGDVALKLAAAHRPLETGERETVAAAATVDRDDRRHATICAVWPPRFPARSCHPTPAVPLSSLTWSNRVRRPVSAPAYNR